MAQEFREPEIVARDSFSEQSTHESEDGDNELTATTAESPEEETTKAEPVHTAFDKAWEAEPEPVAVEASSPSNSAATGFDPSGLLNTPVLAKEEQTPPAPPTLTSPCPSITADMPQEVLQQMLFQLVHMSQEAPVPEEAASLYLTPNRARGEGIESGEEEEEAIKLVVRQNGMFPTPKGSKQTPKAPRTPKPSTPGRKNSNQQTTFGKKKSKHTPRKRGKKEYLHENPLLQTPPTHLIGTGSMEPSPSKGEELRKTFWESKESPIAKTEENNPSLAHVVARGSLAMAGVA